MLDLVKIKELLENKESVTVASSMPVSLEFLKKLKKNGIYPEVVVLNGKTEGLVLRKMTKDFVVESTFSPHKGHIWNIHVQSKISNYLTEPGMDSLRNKEILKAEEKLKAFVSKYVGDIYASAVPSNRLEDMVSILDIEGRVREVRSYIWEFKSVRLDKKEIQMHLKVLSQELVGDNFKDVVATFNGVFSLKLYKVPEESGNW